MRTAIPSGSWLALTLVIASLPPDALAQVDQQALARAIVGGDRRAAQKALGEATRALAPEEMGPELRAALISALERENSRYRGALRATFTGDSGRARELYEAFWGEGYLFLIEAVGALRDSKAIPALVTALGTGSYGVEDEGPPPAPRHHSARVSRRRSRRTASRAAVIADSLVLIVKSTFRFPTIVGASTRSVSTRNQSRAPRSRTTKVDGPRNRLFAYAFGP